MSDPDPIIQWQFDTAAELETYRRMVEPLIQQQQAMSGEPFFRFDRQSIEAKKQLALRCELVRTLLPTPL
jgi:uncharacterized membrane protein YfhO